MLPGMASGNAYGGVTLLQAVATGTAGGVSALAINKPTGTVDGDIMVAVMANGNGTTWTGDTGWTEIIDQGAHPYLRAAYKVASSEGSSYSFTGGTGTKTGFIATFRGFQYDTVSSSVTTLLGDGSLAITGITAAGGILIAAYAMPSGNTLQTSSTPSGMLSLAAASSAGVTDIFGYWQQIAAGATGTRSSTLGDSSGTFNNGGILIALKP